MEHNKFNGAQVQYEFDGEDRSVDLYHNPDQDHFYIGFTRPLKTASTESNLLHNAVIRISDNKKYIQTGIHLSRSATKALLKLLAESPDLNSPDTTTNQQPDKPR